MNPPDTQSTDACSVAARRWRRATIALAFAFCLSVALLVAFSFLSLQDLNTHYNLYYLMWKAGLRPYEPAVVFGGLFHDLSYRNRFLGLSPEEFMRRFPNTFYKVRSRPPILKPNQDLYINNYQQAIGEPGILGACWEALFEDGRLIEFDYGKG